MHVLESSPPIPGRFTSADSALCTPSAACCIGPVDPLECFPIALFSKALDLAVNEFRTQREKVKASPEERSLAVMAAVLDANRTYWGQTDQHEISLVTVPGGSLCLLAQGNLLIDLRLNENFGTVSSGVAPRFFLGRKEDHPDCDRIGALTQVHSDFLVSLSAMITGAIQRQVLHGNPAFIFPEYGELETRDLREVAVSVLGIIKNSPFNPKLSEAAQGKPRFQFIRAINAGDDAEAMHVVESIVRRRPQLLGMPGWCGGVSFHKAAQLGQIELLTKLIYMGKMPEVVNTTGNAVQAYLRLRDADGSTPAHLAHRYGHDECRDLLQSEGGEFECMNKFGFRPHLHR